MRILSSVEVRRAAVLFSALAAVAGTAPGLAGDAEDAVVAQELTNTIADLVTMPSSWTSIET